MSGHDRLPWEAIDEHWRARIQFVEHHKGVHGLEKAVTLSHVWYNVYYHASQYPPDVQQLVARWEPILDDLPVITEKKETSGASVSRDISNPARDDENGVHSLITESDIPDIELSKVSSDLLDLSRKLFIEDMSCITEAVSSLYNCAQKSRISIKFDELRDQARAADAQVVLTAVLDGVRVAAATGPSRKAAKREAALASLKKLIALQRQQGINQKQRWKPEVKEEEAVARDDLVDGKQREEERLPDSNVGSQMLMKMGWSGVGGLGKGENKGIETPLMPSGNLGREGLGARSGDKVIDRRMVEQELRQFVINDTAQEITFSSDLTAEDRRIVHEVAQQLHLKHRSFEVSGQRYLIVSKETRDSEVQARKDYLREELGVDWNNRQTDRPNRKHGREEYGNPSREFDDNRAKMSRFDASHGHAGQYGYDDKRQDETRGYHGDQRRYGYGTSQMPWQGRR